MVDHLMPMNFRLPSMSCRANSVVLKLKSSECQQRADNHEAKGSAALGIQGMNKFIDAGGERPRTEGVVHAGLFREIEKTFYVADTHIIEQIFYMSIRNHLTKLLVTAYPSYQTFGKLSV